MNILENDVCDNLVKGGVLDLKWCPIECEIDIFIHEGVICGILGLMV